MGRASKTGQKLAGGQFPIEACRPGGAFINESRESFDEVRAGSQHGSGIVRGRDAADPDNGLLRAQVRSQDFYDLQGAAP